LKSASQSHASLFISIHGTLFIASITLFNHFIARFHAFCIATQTFVAIPLNTQTSASASHNHKSQITFTDKTTTSMILLKVQTIDVYKIFHQSQILLKNAFQTSICAQSIITRILKRDFIAVTIKFTPTQNHCTIFIKTKANHCMSLLF